MSAIEKNFMDYDNLVEYDENIKEHISEEDSKSYKTILPSADGEELLFFKKANATLADTPDYTYYPQIYVSGVKVEDNVLVFSPGYPVRRDGNKLVIG